MAVNGEINGETQPQRRRSKPANFITTIHGYAQKGDIVGVQKKLADDPSLLNSKNAVVSIQSLILFFSFFLADPYLIQ